MKGWQFTGEYEELPPIFYASVALEPVVSPRLLVWNEAVAEMLGLRREDVPLSVLAGCDMPEGAAQIAQSYAGHQFGHFTMLGDGRALLIGEQQVGDKVFDVQLKGAGRTPYSRGGDGRAAVGPMLREYMISEAMHALGIPTTRSLAVVATGEKIQRAQLLDGAILTRVASSHVRVGTFEFAARFAETEDVRALAHFVMNRHYPHCLEADNPYEALLQAVVERQAKLIAQWQLVGFVHGVMNTDNMTISGETIDYGPCAFMDVFDPDTVFSSIDAGGRYAYGNQPKIASWNLARFAETLLRLIDADSARAIEQAKAVLATFPEQFTTHWLAGMRMKLGWQTVRDEDGALIEELLRFMEVAELDYTNTLRQLSHGEAPAPLSEWHDKWRARLVAEQGNVEQACARMLQANPAVIARNYYVEEALTAAGQGDLTKFQQLVAALKTPFVEQQAYMHPPQGPYMTFCGT